MTTPDPIRTADPLDPYLTPDEPVADNDFNLRRMVDSASALREAYRRRGERAYVSIHLAVYPVEGDPGIRNVPDLLVAPGCDDHGRFSFRYWDEPGTVDFAGEFLSPARGERFGDRDIERRIEVYRDALRTREVFVYAPRTKELEDGFDFHFLRLDDAGRYEDVGPGEHGWYASLVLGLEFRPLDEALEFRDPATGRVFLPDSRRAERASRESERADRAEARLRQLERELERLRGPDR